MPIPTPRKDEEKNKYIPRCSSFLHGENKNRKVKRSNGQIQAICHGLWDKRLQKRTMLGQPKFKIQGNALLIEGVLLESGVWIGLDNVPTNYSKEFIRNVKNTLIGTPIRFAHKISEESMLEEIPEGETVGFWTGSQGDGVCNARGYIFNPIAINYVKTHPKIGLSMEALVHTEYESSLGVEDAKHGMLIGGVLIDDPACPGCHVRTIREVKLGKKMKGVLNVTDDFKALEETIEEETIEESESEGKKPFIEFDEKSEVEPTRKAFFAHIMTELKTAKIPDELTGKIVKVLKAVVKNPFTIVAPKIAPKALETGLPADAKLEAKLKAIGIPDELLTPLMTVLNPLLATPAPETKELPVPAPGLEKLMEELTKTKTDLKVLQDAAAKTREEEMNKLISDVKELDKDFDPKMLETFKDPCTRKVFLEKYLAALKKTVKPIALQIGEDKAKTVVAGVTKEMFGERTFEDIFDIKPPGDK